MGKSLSELLNRKIVWSQCQGRPMSLNEVLQLAQDCDSNMHIQTLDRKLVGLLNADGFTDEQRAAIRLVLKEVQKMYEPTTIHFHD